MLDPTIVTATAAAGDFKTPMSKELLMAMTAVRERFAAQEKRIAALEIARDRQALDVALKSQAAAAQQQAQPPEDLYAPLRNDTKAITDLAAFARRLLDSEDVLFWEAGPNVRRAAREALGLK